MKKPSDERPLGRRVTWAAASQVASSITNLALYAGLLLTSDTERFGRWVAVLAVYHLTIALARSLVGEPMVASAGAPGRPGGPGAAGAAGGGGSPFSWAWARDRYRRIGIGASLGAAAVGWRVGADGPTVIAFALAVPFLLAQDGLRSLAWARGRPAGSVLLDAVWIVTTGALLVVARAAGRVPAEAVVACWLAGGLASSAAGARLVGRGRVAARTEPGWGRVAARIEPGPGPVEPAGPGPGLEERLHARRRSQALLTTARNLLPIVVATILGPAPAGLLKAALLPYTPMLSLLAGMRLVVLPGMQRAAQRSADALDRFVVRLVAGYLVVAGSAAAAVLALAAMATARLDGAPEALRPEVIGWGAVVAVTMTVSTPLADAMGYGRRSGPVVGRRLVEVALEWGAVLAAGARFGPEGVVVGWAVGVAVGALLWLVPTLGRRRDVAPDGPPPGGALGGAGGTAASTPR